MLDALAALAKALLYGSLLLSAGIVFAQASLSNSSSLDAIALPWMRRSSIAVIAASVVGALVLVLRLGGEFDEEIVAAVLSSATGATLFMQLAGAIVLLGCGGPGARGIRLTSAGLLVLSLGFSGHAAMVGPFEGLFVFVHASAAAWWAGSLCLLLYACENFEFIAIAGLVRKFSQLATYVVGGLVMAGLLLIYVLVGFQAFPSLSNYEKYLALKLAVVAFVLALACYNKFRLTPRLLLGDRTAVSELRKMIGIELIAIAIVLIVTAVLTTYTSPHEGSEL